MPNKGGCDQQVLEQQQLLLWRRQAAACQQRLWPTAEVAGPRDPLCAAAAGSGAADSCGTGQEAAERCVCSQAGAAAAADPRTEDVVASCCALLPDGDSRFVEAVKWHLLAGVVRLRAGGAVGAVVSPAAAVACRACCGRAGQLSKQCFLDPAPASPGHLGSEAAHNPG